MTKRVLLTASALERVLACPASAALPAIYSSGEDAERGRQIGAYVRAVLGGVAVDKALLPVAPQWRETCKSLQWQKLVGDLHEVRGEMAYGIHPDTMEVRELGSNLGRNYPKIPDGWIAGTNDIEGARALDDVPVAIDIKSGQEVTAAEENPQVRFHALARHLMTGAPEAEGRIAYVREDGRVFLDAHLFDAFDLQAYADELADGRERVHRAIERFAAGEPLSVSSGSWCKYCPAMAACPRYTALARSALPTLQELVQGGDVEAVKARFAVMPQEEQARAWRIVVEIGRLHEMMDTALRALAKQRRIPLGDGKVLREITGTTSRFNQGRAVESLRKRGATDAEIVALWDEKESSSVRETNDPDAPKPKRTRRRMVA